MKRGAKQQTADGPKTDVEGASESIRKDSNRGLVGFDEFYTDMWGDRWASLRAALFGPAKKMSVENPFAGSGLRTHYEMDPASVLVAKLVGSMRQVSTEADAETPLRVLDMCAAPGGKSLVQIFAAEKARANDDASAHEWNMNDLSRDRVYKLKNVMAEYLPMSIRERLQITTFDASKFGIHKPAQFDRILLDAPCSGERHVLEDEKALNEWGPQRTKGLAARQYALFCSAELALKTGGRMVYSTCTLSHLENDEVIGRFFERRAKKKLAPTITAFSIEEILAEPGVAELVRENQIVLEPTKYGAYILPDRSQGAGPMFLSVFLKQPF